MDKQTVKENLLSILPKKLVYSVPIPQVKLEHISDDCFGYYIPRYQRIGLNMLEIKDEEQFFSTLIHEWRHHWQYLTRTNYQTKQEYIPFCTTTAINDPEGVDVGYIKYYLYNKCEMDALKFQLKYYPCNTAIEAFLLIKQYYPKLINRLNRQLEGIYETSDNNLSK